MDAQTIIAKRIAKELHSGMLVNLGIGIPTFVANHVPVGVSIFFQSENGLIGTGPIPEEGMAHPTLTDAAGHKATITQADEQFSNGVVHQVDAVLMPAEEQASKPAVGQKAGG